MAADNTRNRRAMSTPFDGAFSVPFCGWVPGHQMRRKCIWRNEFRAAGGPPSSSSLSARCEDQLPLTLPKPVCYITPPALRLAEV